MELGKVLKLLAAKLWLHKHMHLVIKDLYEMSERLGIYMVLLDKDVAEILRAARLLIIQAMFSLHDKLVEG